MINRQLSIAPMMNWTNRHFRYLLRLISPSVLLYTEMIAIDSLFCNRKTHSLLKFNPLEHPLVLQLGGSDPHKLAYGARCAQQYGYDEINLNVGCPSGRVKKGMFGACLMAFPQVVADAVDAMQTVVNIPISVKTRIGIDEYDSYEQLANFINTIAKTGCRFFIIHARKAWLQGVSPRYNRTVPPLRYDYVYQLKKDFPQLHITINGGIRVVDEIFTHLKLIDGVMVGRVIIDNPLWLRIINEQLYKETSNSLGLASLINQYGEYAQEQQLEGERLNSLVRPLMGLFHGLPGAKLWRRSLTHPNGTVKTLLADLCQAIEIIN